MSAILSAEDLNDFISPGVACIKPVETLPAQRPDSEKTTNPYEVITEDQLAAQGGGNTTNAQISLTDCLACSGCVTSAEAVLVSLQSHEEVLSTLDKYPELSWQEAQQDPSGSKAGKIFVATVSPQTRASIAATYGVSERQAGHMIEQLLRGPQGVKSGGQHGSGFTWVLDSNTVRELCHEAGVQEVLNATKPAGPTKEDMPKKPVLASSCPGWICYAEKTHPHVLPHLSRLKSPQAMAGTMIKSVLHRKFGVAPDRIWHVAVMPCFDKKLEASREELTDVRWQPGSTEKRGVRDVDCVITARELVMLADSRGIRMPNLPRTPVLATQVAFPDAQLDKFLFPYGRRRPLHQQLSGGSSGGYAYHILQTVQQQTPGSQIRTVRGRNIDVVDYILVRGEETIMKTARYYGFRNIQNLVRGLRPAKASRLPGSRMNRPGAPGGAKAGGFIDYAYVEVMACPGGCTNGGGQIKASDVASMRGLADPGQRVGPAEQKQWLAQVDEAYFSSESASEDGGDGAINVDDPALGNGNSSTGDVKQVLQHWSSVTGVDVDKLVLTSYRAVESDVGKEKPTDDMQQVAGLAASIGGGW